MKTHFNMMSMRSVLPFNDFSSERFSSKNIQGDQKKRQVLIRSLVLKILIDFCCKWRHGALLLLLPLAGGILSHLEALGDFWGLCLLWPFPLPQSVSISFDFLTASADSLTLTLSQAVYKKNLFRLRMKMYICAVRKPAVYESITAAL